jgi:glyoxylase I family protein
VIVSLVLWPREELAKGGEEMDTLDPAVAPRSTLLKQLPLRLHHHAFVVRDHEVNRRFFEDLLGIPLVATWCESLFSDELKKKIDYCHTFFAMADGGALAFFQFADEEMYRRCIAERPAEIGYFDHIAFKVEPATYAEILARLEAAGAAHRERDHGYCKSLYTTSPDGLIVEFTVDAPDVSEIEAIRRADAHSELERWLAGDRRVNNDLRAHR